MAFDRCLLAYDRRHEYALWPGFAGWFNGRIQVRHEAAGVVVDGYLLRQRFLELRSTSGRSMCTSPHRMLSLLWASQVQSVAAELRVVVSSERCRAISQIAERACLADIRAAVARAMRAGALNKWEVAFWRDFDARAEAA